MADLKDLEQLVNLSVKDVNELSNNILKEEYGIEPSKKSEYEKVGPFPSWAVT